jgi:NADH:ubiquinone reductase (H+-translocating)
MVHNIPETDKKRVVVVGAGFGGLMLAQKLVKNDDLQVVLIDKNNYHQFQPLFYQVATAFLEPSAIAFPLRKIFQKEKNICIRVAEVQRIDTQKKEIDTTLGAIHYDELIVATGADTNYFGLKNIQDNAIPMKSVGEALTLRNTILKNFEDAVTTTDPEARAALMNIAVVGGGPTGGRHLGRNEAVYFAKRLS